MSNPASPTTCHPELSRQFGLRIFLKPEIHSATGSYKDRLAPAAIAEAIQAGATRVVVTSSGNQGLAIAHAARAAGIPGLVLATQHILPVYRDALRDLGAELGFTVDWDAASGTVVLTTGSTEPQSPAASVSPAAEAQSAAAAPLVTALPEESVLPASPAA